jgi:hypothetical protein
MGNLQTFIKIHPQQNHDFIENISLSFSLPSTLSPAGKLSTPAPTILLTKLKISFEMLAVPPPTAAAAAAEPLESSDMASVTRPRLPYVATKDVGGLAADDVDVTRIAVRGMGVKATVVTRRVGVRRILMMDGFIGPCVLL